MLKPISFAFCLLLAALSAGADTARPNIIFMMADDLGYNDVGAYGQSTIPTPNLDRLASEGVRLTAAYSPSAVCSPTRYAVMTGTDPCRRYLTSHVLFNAEPLVIEEDELTVAQSLKSSGYATGIVGKWHLGLGTQLPRDPNHPGRGPNDLGFDYSFIVPDGHNMKPDVYHENGEIVGGTGNGFDSDLQVAERVNLKLLAYKTSPSWPYRRVYEEIGTTLADKADAFIEANHDRPFFLYYATHAIHDPQVSSTQFKGKSGIGPHGDFVMEFDWAVGRIMAKLDELGLAENTLFIVTSDNGGLKQVNGHRPTDPWRDMKGSRFEGGTRVPLLASWPGHIPADSVSSQPVSLVDLFCTTSRLAGMAVPPRAALDSYDMLPVLTGADSPRPYLVTSTRGMTWLSLRQAGWKLNLDTSNPANRELYYLPDDPAETVNLATRRPEKADELSSLVMEYIEAGASRPGALGTPSTLSDILAQRQARNEIVTELMEDIHPSAPAQALESGPRAIVEALGQTPSTLPFRQGEELFNDRPYRLLPVPEALAGHAFLQGSLSKGLNVRCTQAGWIWVVTPAKGVNPDSLADKLEANGFTLANLPAFNLFSPKKNNQCVVYQKQLKAGETLTLGKWGILLTGPATQPL